MKKRSNEEVATAYFTPLIEQACNRGSMMFWFVVKKPTRWPQTSLSVESGPRNRQYQRSDISIHR